MVWWTMKLLDLFCGAGGAAMGYHRAGFEIVGVDIRPQPRYPFAFVQADALVYARLHAHEYDGLHASPPCQAYSVASPRGREYPEFIEPVRAILNASGRPWIIENVPGSERHLRPLITLCGTMFGLRVYRHRHFESSVMLLQPAHVRHVERCVPVGRKAAPRQMMTVAGNFASLDAAKAAMGIDWDVTRRELSQAIPPAYTEFIGRQLMRAIHEARGED